MDYKTILFKLIEEIDVYIGEEKIPTLEQCLRPPMRRGKNVHGCWMCGDTKMKTKLMSFSWGGTPTAPPTLCNFCLNKNVTDLKFSFKKGGIICSNCYEQKSRGTVFNTFSHVGPLTLCDSCFTSPSRYDPYKNIREITTTILDEISKIKIQETKTKEIQSDMKELYQSQGLSESFARSIAEGNNANEVMDLWDMDWWKQYPEDDLIVTQVLKGELTASQADYLNSIRSDHGGAVSEVLEGLITFDWLKALMDAGYQSHPNAVEPILKGADPVVIARIHKIKINQETLPPSLKS